MNHVDLRCDPAVQMKTTPQRSDLMKRVRQKRTSAEMTVRRVLSGLGFHFRTNVRDLPGSPDIAHKGLRKAIFVNGCYWHHHEACGRGTIPKSNARFWKAKFDSNRRRDQAKVDGLKKLGFEVLVVWECELEDRDLLEERLRSFWMTTPRTVRASGTGDGVLGLVDVRSSNDRVEDFFLHSGAGYLERRVALENGGYAVSRVPTNEPVTDDDYAAAFDRAWLRSKMLPQVGRSRGVVDIVDLFSGCGGMTLGAVEACRALELEAHPRFAVDVDQTARETYVANFPTASASGSDIKEILSGCIGSSLTTEERALKRQFGSPHLVLGGPPCQGHSDLNNHTRRSDPKNALFMKMARCAEVLEPRHMIIENVHGVLHDAGGVFGRTRDRLATLGYDVDWGVLRGEELGVPQARHRVFLVASRDKIPSLDGLSATYAVPPRSSDWATLDLLVAAHGREFDRPSDTSETNRRRIEYLFAHDLYELPDSERPPCHRDKSHTYRSVYGRIRPDSPAPTITTGFTSMGQGRFVHPHRPRTITPHEAARLQFFPDYFLFGDLGRDAYRMLVGNAVPSKFTYLITLELLR